MSTCVDAIARFTNRTYVLADFPRKRGGMRAQYLLHLARIEGDDVQTKSDSLFILGEGLVRKEGDEGGG